MKKYILLLTAALFILCLLVSCGDANVKKTPQISGYDLKGSVTLTKEIRDESRGVTQYTNVECKLDGCFLTPATIKWTSTGTVVGVAVQCPESWGGEMLTALMTGLSIEGKLQGGGVATLLSSSKEMDWKKKQIKVHAVFDLPGNTEGKLTCILATEYASEIDGSPMKLNQPMEVSIDETASVTPVKQYIQSGTFSIEIPH